MISCDTLDHLQSRQWAQVPDFFTEEELQSLKKSALLRWEKGLFQPAQVGRSQERQRAAQIRSDWTCWIDLQDPTLSFFSEKIAALMRELNQQFFLGIRSFECHFARYAEGQFYEEHIDQSSQASPLHGERVISFVLYLNENWQPGNGGELSIQFPGERALQISPTWGNLVLFRSDTVPHAVLPSKTERWSLTGWFRRS